MGLTSGRGSHGGARRRGAGSARQGSAWQGDGGYNRTSLVGGDQQETGYGWNHYPVTGGGQRQATGFLDGAPAGRRAHARRRRGVGRWLTGYSAPVLSVVAIVVCAALVAAGLGVNHILTARSAADATANPNCTLIVPANPLTAQGLATPYQLTATDQAAGPCDESNDNQTAFVQGAVLNPRTGQVSIYDPLVVNAGTQPAVAPVVPRLPAGAVVAVWFGYNGNTLTLAGADQNLTSGATATATPTNATSQATQTTSPSGSGSATATAPASTTTPTNSATPTGSAPTGSGASATATPTATGSASTGTQGTGAPSSAATAGGASVQSVGSAPLPPSPAGSAGWLNASLSGTNGQGAAGSLHHPHPSSPASGAATPSSSGAAPTVSAAPTGSAAPTASATPSASAPATTAGGTATNPPANPGDSPAAAPTQDAILQQASCVAGEDISGEFSSFTQVGACNATAFFNAANMAIAARKLRVPAPGTAKDRQACLTTRSFALIDQDQSDNVTTEYLTTANGQTAQDTAANRGSLGGAATLFNGSDNGLLDLFVDPALGCSPWEVPNLADGGAPAPGLPLDELQAAAWAGRQGGGPSALVPLNDPMTVDGNGNFSTDKTNTYRSLVDMPALPAGQSAAAYCSDMEKIQGSRLQQDVNLLIKGPSPVPAAASNLFTFLAMRLQQSFMNLNCGTFGMNNDVSTTTDGNGVVVAACFANQVRAMTRGQGNPMAGQTQCPATTSGQGNGQGNGQSTGQGTGQPSGSPSATPSPSGMSHQGVRNYWHHHHHG